MLANYVGHEFGKYDVAVAYGVADAGVWVRLPLLALSLIPKWSRGLTVNQVLADSSSVRLPMVNLKRVSLLEGEAVYDLGSFTRVEIDRNGIITGDGKEICRVTTEFRNFRVPTKIEDRYLFEGKLLVE